MRIEIPHNFIPRHYQRPLFVAREKGVRRFFDVIHRRGGKDKTHLNLMIREMITRVGNYYYYFPTAKQGREALWDGKDKAGFPFLGHFPRDLIAGRRDDIMQVRLKNGSLFQVLGTNDPDTKVGPNPVGCVFSEWALQDPTIWDLIRPILVENEGWAAFNTTPRGHNHAYEMYRMAIADDRWFCQRLAACEHPVFNPGGEIPFTAVLTPEQIDAEIEQGMSESMARQEFFCDWDVSGDSILIPIQLVEAAYDRRVGGYSTLPKVMGVDVGMSLGGDPSAICGRQGPAVVELEEFRYDDTMQIAGHVRDRFRDGGYLRGYIDSIGWGAGVAHVLASWGLPFTAVNVAEAASESERFQRHRDELWWRGREFFAGKGCVVKASPLRSKLANELSGPTYSYLPNGRIKVESKDDLVKRGVKSPNLADALLLTLQDGTVTINDTLPSVRMSPTFGMLVGPDGRVADYGGPALV